MGYTNVYIMPAGIAGWERAGKPEEKGVAYRRARVLGLGAAPHRPAPSE